MVSSCCGSVCSEQGCGQGCCQSHSCRTTWCQPSYCRTTHCQPSCCVSSCCCVFSCCHPKCCISSSCRPSCCVSSHCLLNCIVPAALCPAVAVPAALCPAATIPAAANLVVALLSFARPLAVTHSSVDHFAEFHPWPLLSGQPTCQLSTRLPHFLCLPLLALYWPVIPASIHPIDYDIKQRLKSNCLS